MRLIDSSLVKRLLPLAVVGLFSVSAAEAALVVPAGNGLVVNDTDLNITWTQDANLFKTMASSNPELVSQIAAVMPSYNDPAFGVQTIDAGDFDTFSGTMSWWGAKAWVSYLNSISYAGQTGWRLPQVTPVNGSSFNYDYSTNGTTDVGYNTTAVNPNSSELAHVFFNELGNKGAYNTAGLSQPGYGVTNSGPFSNLQNNLYWSGTEFAPNPARAWYFATQDGSQFANFRANQKFIQYYGWAVRPGQVTAVPVPAAAWLMGSALLGLLGLGRRKAGTLAMG